ISVIFPEKSPSGRGYVYIGQGGLLGGGNAGSSQQQGEQKGCNFSLDQRIPDPDNPGKWVCPGPGKHPRTPPPSSASSSSSSSSASSNSYSNSSSPSSDESQQEAREKALRWQNKQRAEQQERDRWFDQSDQRWREVQEYRRQREQRREEIREWNQLIDDRIWAIKKNILESPYVTYRKKPNVNSLQELETLLRSIQGAFEEIDEASRNLKVGYE
ncbi:hypothetical protein GR268_43610, partial [Rhizobium leguminosarum]|nr:hypothetical protein [Rhizobium leguminosarum]